jgi:hypothetical protein
VDILDMSIAMMKSNAMVSLAVITLHLIATGCSSSRDSSLVASKDMSEDAVVASRDFIAKDEPALRIFGARDSIAMTVSDTIECINIPSIASTVHGLVEALYPERADPDYLRDSLDRVGSSLPRCESSTQMHLARLSTSSDRRATLIFVRLDSTLRTGYYAVMAYLFKDRRTDEEDPAATVGYDKMIAYLLVYNPHAELIFVRREERP